MSTAIKKTFQLGRHTVSLETGEIARQTDASVMVNMEGTVVLATVVAEKMPKDVRDFFPLTVNYQEKTYAAGRIPGGFFKREGRPSERETLIARLIDRPIRPLFHDDFTHEVQVVVTVMSVNPDIEPDVVSIIAASAALTIAGLPFNGPIGAVRMGYHEGLFLLNPSPTELAGSSLNLVVAGTEQAVLMVESEAKGLSEEIMLEAVWCGHQQMQSIIQAIKEFSEMVGKAKWSWQPPVHNEGLLNNLTAMIESELANAFLIKDKLTRNAAIAQTKAKAMEQLAGEGEGRFTEREVHDYFEKLSRKIVRTRVLEGSPRIDGRNTRTVRPISIRVGVLPRTHGSALFTRGETQALVVATLGTGRDAQILDSLMGEEKDHFIFHYNFPPYCVGEMGMMGSPKRREIGHGRLAKRGIQAVLPSDKEFPYVLRVVSEITESNGSSSMASVCGSSLALMDAGVPIKAPVAGIAMGLIKEENRFAILTDIIGDEDHLGDMDFKVAGTADGVTALQMDIKIDGITKYIMQKALEQAKEGRLHILEKMNAIICEPRQQISAYAPSIRTIQIKPEKIREVIGKGGATIKSIVEETGADINIDDHGLVHVAAVDDKAMQAALARIRDIVADVEVGQCYEGKVVRIMDFGAFVNLIGSKDGFLHISQIADARIERLQDYVKEGDMVKVKVVEIDSSGRVRLTMKP
ncbi:MAG TPA: polyribonucleotide nucleotidyltransferase, partial [Coxiellaceae bacterium]|nr:polyribonucleotide nucleotidyltransferase [Coxiellaceae bacterium]